LTPAKLHGEIEPAFCSTSSGTVGIFQLDSERQGAAYPMSESEVVANQKIIIQNQKTIIANQAALRANQKTIQGNQGRILKNQAGILKNQSALNTIVKNQKQILARLKK
jgi:hypothetical protein